MSERLIAIHQMQLTRSSTAAAFFCGDLDFRFLDPLVGSGTGSAFGSFSFLGGAGTCRTFLPPKKSAASTTGSGCFSSGLVLLGPADTGADLAGDPRLDLGLSGQKGNASHQQTDALKRPILRRALFIVVRV